MLSMMDGYTSFYILAILDGHAQFFIQWWMGGGGVDFKTNNVHRRYVQIRWFLNLTLI